MNKCIIDRWNEVIGPRDHVYVLGDVSFAGLQSTLNMLDMMHGKKFLVAGNHDRSMRKRAEFQKRFEWIKDYFHLVVQDEKHPAGKQNVMLMHFPLLTWDKSRYGSWMLHGHSHGAIQELNQGICRMDVGVDTNDMYPYRYSQIKQIMQAKTNKTYDL